MKESFILNFNLLKEVELSVEEFLYLINLYMKVENKNILVNVNRLQKDKFIKIIRLNNEGKIILREKSINILKFLSTDVEISFNEKKKIVKKSKRVINHEIEERIQEYRYI